MFLKEGFLYRFHMHFWFMTRGKGRGKKNSKNLEHLDKTFITHSVAVLYIKY